MEAGCGPASVVFDETLGEYDFGPEHAREIEREVGGVPIAYVDGRDLFWWGIRTPPAANRLAGALVRP